MTSQEEGTALLLEFWRERERKKSNEPQSAWESLMPPKAPGIVPEQKKHTAQGNHSDRAVRYETETAYEGASAC